MIQIQISQSSPIFRLPYDALYTILLLASPSAYQPRGEFPITMSLVCKSWREVVIESPILWSDIAFDHPPPFPRQRLWIERSRGARLTITIDYCYNVKQTVELIRLLRPHVARWRSLSLTSTRNFKAKSYRLFFDELRHEYAPELEELHVPCYGNTYGWTFRPFAHGAPRLKRLTLGSCRLLGEVSLVGRLTDLIISDASWGVRPFPYPTSTHDLFRVLANACLTIERVYIDIPSCRSLAKSDSHTFPINLRNLLYLSLSDPPYPSYIPRSWTLNVYSGIFAPSLRDHTLSPTAVNHLISRDIFPFPGLRLLTIKHGNSDFENPQQIEIPRATFQSLLSQLPQLQELTIYNIACFDHRILATLGLQLRRLTIFVPAVSEAIRGSPGIQGTIAARRLLAQNRGTVDTLNYVLLKDYELPDEEVEWLKVHIQEFLYLQTSRPL